MRLLLALSMLLAAPASAATTLDFVGSIGVCTHLDASDSTYGRVGAVLEQLRYIGVRRLRDTVVGVGELAPFRQAAAAGMSFDLIVMGDPEAALPTLRALGPALHAVEGPNEVNVTEVRYRGQRGPAAAIAVQRTLYAAVKRDPALKRLPVLSFSVAQGGPMAPYGNLAAIADAVSVHAYAEFGVPPYWMLKPVIAAVTLAPGRPAIVTEIGNYTLADRKTGVSESVQAKWLLDTLFDSFAQGIAATYVYELEDERMDAANKDPEAHFGLFTEAGQPKKAAHALHNLGSILRSRATAGVRETVPYAVRDMPEYGFHLALAKSPGVTDIVLWAEPPIWDRKAGRETPGVERIVTVTLPRPARAIRVYDPLVGTEPLLESADRDSVAVSLTDHPVIVEVVEP